MTSLSLPSQGRPHDEILADLDAFSDGDADFKGGRTWSMIYWAGEQHHDLVRAAHDRYLALNGLNPMAFASLRRMEADVVAMSTTLFHGADDTGGTMTSGGTESILVAVKTWRDFARKKHPLRFGSGRRRPEIVAPVTVHPAFAKAAHLFGLRLRLVPTDEDGVVDPKRLARHIGRRTVLVVASAPQYAHGVVDPVPELAEIAARKGVPLHVDACFGGFIQPWLERLGVEMPTWDFRVPGVASISADLHKYGYAAKGASVLLYRDAAMLRHQFFVSTDWPGGIYASPGLPGTRPGGPIAAAWASLMGMGEDGYLARAREALDAVQQLRTGIESIPELRLLGRPHSVIATWAAKVEGGKPAVDVFAVADLLQARGWSVDRQQRPNSIHCSVNAANLPVIDAYLDDLRQCVAQARADPSLSREGDAAVYGLMARVPVRGLVKQGVLDLMEQMYGPGAELPELSGEDGPLPAWGQKVLDLADRVKAKVAGVAA